MDESGKRVPEAEIPPEDLPRCEQAGCGGLLRPSVVWFGESIPGLDAIESVVEVADMCLVVGTSSVVRFTCSEGLVLWMLVLLCG
jgi:NAD-dependent deacetylase sirtuin 5